MSREMIEKEMQDIIEWDGTAHAKSYCIERIEGKLEGYDLAVQEITEWIKLHSVISGLPKGILQIQFNINEYEKMFGGEKE